MLLRIGCPSCGEKFWIDLNLEFERRYYASALLELEEYFLKNISIRETYSDEEISYHIKRTIAGFLKLRKFSKAQIIEDVSKLYGVPESIVAELYEVVIHDIYSY